MRTQIALVSVLVLLAGFAPSTMAITHHVKQDGTGDFTNIKDACIAAVDGDTVLIYPGTYTGSDNREIHIDARNLVLRAESSTPVIDLEGQGRAFWLSGGIGYDTVIRSLRFENGYAWDFMEDGGGAILCANASPIIEYCSFVNCSGEFGGAIKLLYSDAVIRYCTILDCTADYGGAVSATSNAPMLDLVNMFGNTANEGGGAFRCYNGSPTVYGCTIALSSCLGRGAAVEFAGASPNATLTRSIVAFSEAGGAVEGGVTGTIDQCIVYGNVGGDGVPAYAGEVLNVDPRFCDLYTYDIWVCENSQTLGGNNSWGHDIGYIASGCPPCESPVEVTSWGCIKTLFW